MDKNGRDITSGECNICNPPCKWSEDTKIVGEIVEVVVTGKKHKPRNLQ